MNSIAIGILENTRILSDDKHYQQTITDAIQEVQALYLARDYLEAQLEALKIFTHKPETKVLRITSTGVETAQLNGSSDENQI